MPHKPGVCGSVAVHQSASGDLGCSLAAAVVAKDPARTWAASREPSSAERSLVAAEAEPHPPLSGLVDQRRVAGANHKTNASPAALNAFLLLTAATGSSIGGHTGVWLVPITPTGCLGMASLANAARWALKPQAHCSLLPPPGPRKQKQKWAAGWRCEGPAQALGSLTQAVPRLRRQFPRGVLGQLDAPSKSASQLPKLQVYKPVDEGVG